jgi:hypothetical protein
MADRTRAAVVVAFAISFLFAALDVEGCTCMHRKLGSPCMVSADPTAIFSGTVMKVVPGRDTPPRAATVATISTERWYKGKGEGVVEVSTASSSGFCGFPFAAGQRLLLFANGSGKRFSTDICMATTSLDAAGYLLDYLGRSDLGKKARLEGVWMKGFEPVRGTVIVKGSKGAKLDTDQNGRFAVNGLASGKYTISFQPYGEGLTTPPDQTITLAAGKCSAFIVRSCAQRSGAGCDPPKLFTMDSLAK